MISMVALIIQENSRNDVKDHNNWSFACFSERGSTKVYLSKIMY
jgi:hypothetical protein